MSWKEDVIFDFGFKLPRVLIVGNTAVLDNISKVVMIGEREICVENAIRETLAEEGMFEGGLKVLDYDYLEKVLYNKFPNIVWARIAYQGRYVNVSIAEGELNDLKKTEKKEKPCNIIARKSCYIDKILPFRGVALVERNDFVRKGQVLISGKVEYESTTYDEDKEKEYFVHSDGIIKGRVPYKIRLSYFINCDKISENDLNGKINEDLARWLEKNAPKDSQILNKSLNFSREENIIVVDVVAEVLQDVGEEKVILIGKK